MERISSGIPGFDELIDGGIANSSVTLVMGDAGTGKTVFATQYLMEGLENGETCLYITTEEGPEEIKEDAESFGWDLDSHEDDGALEIQYIDPSTRSNYFREDIEKAAKELEPDRVVIDSISVVGAYWGEDDSVRSNITHLIKGFREMDTTVLITAESPEHADDTRYGIAEFVVDGVVKLQAKPMGSGLQRTINVSKMRATDIDGGIHDLEFTDDGLKVE